MKGLVVCVGLLSTSGCADTRFHLIDEESATEVPSVVVFSRSRFFGRAYYPYLMVDGQMRGLVMSGSFITLSLPRGGHVITVEGVSIPVEGGVSTTYIEVAPAAFRNEPRVVSRVEALEVIEDLRRTPGIDTSPSAL